MPRRDVADVPDPICRRDRGKKYSQKFSESDGYGGNRSSLDHEEKCPAVEKTPHGTECFSQLDVLATSAGHHGSEFAITQGADNPHDGGYNPCPNEEGRRIDATPDVGGNNKYAGADHRTDNERGRTEESQSLNKMRRSRIYVGGQWRCAAGRHLLSVLPETREKVSNLSLIHIS